jgi:glycosyltransferase involved in cell wall biosynthesis
VLVVIGPAPSVSELKLSADLGGRILYAGPCVDGLMFKLLKASQFLFFPSLSEGFGLPVVESLLLGTPVLALETHINREVSLGLMTNFECGSVSSIRNAAGRIAPIRPEHPVRLALTAAYDPVSISDRYVQTIREFL